MRHQSKDRFLAVVLLGIACALPAPAQSVSLQEQLNAQYKLAKMGSDSGGVSVVEPGTLLAVQKGGILSVPWTNAVYCAAKFENGSLHPSTGFCAAMVKNISKFYKSGDKVYPVKIEVNFEKAKITFTIVSCDQCNGVDPPSSMKGQVLFQFAKGYLEKANAGEVEDTIGQVFSISDDQGGGQQQGQAGGDQGGGGDQQGQQQQGQQQQSEPQTIEKGMSPDQVQGALGRPEKIVNLGAKQIYIYKDMKVTFLNGKVSDVQ